MRLLTEARLTTRLNALHSALKDLGIEHFRNPRWLCRTYLDEWPSNWRNHYPPPTGMVRRIANTVTMADEIRERWGAPVKCLSGYRTPVYNDLLGQSAREHRGAEDSQHLYFRAMDLRPIDGEIAGFRELTYEVVREWRAEGYFCGVGFYSSFCHIDIGRYSRQREWGMEYL